MNRWKLAAFAIVVLAAALALFLAASVCWHRCCAAQETVYVTQEPITRTVRETAIPLAPLPTYTPAPAPRPIVVYQPTVVEVEVTRVVRETVVVNTFYTPTPPTTGKG